MHYNFPDQFFFLFPLSLVVSLPSFSSFLLFLLVSLPSLTIKCLFPLQVSGFLHFPELLSFSFCPSVWPLTHPFIFIFQLDDYIFYSATKPLSSVFILSSSHFFITLPCILFFLLFFFFPSTARIFQFFLGCFLFSSMYFFLVALNFIFCPRFPPCF